MRLLPALILVLLAAQLGPIHASAKDAGAERAATLPYASDPAFQSWIAEWLRGADDLASIETLSRLAQAGNPAAQVFLGELAARPYLLPPALDDMESRARNALIRAPVGEWGRDWREVAGEELELAAALARQFGSGQGGWSHVEADLDLFLSAGERRAALLLVHRQTQAGNYPILAGRGTNSLLRDEALASLDYAYRRLSVPDYGLQDMALAQRIAGTMADMQITGAEFAFARAAERGPTLRQRDPQAWETAARAAPEARLAAPFAPFCTRHCPQTAGACMLTLTATLGGLPGYITLSPLETLIPTEAYRTSARFERDLRRAYVPTLPMIAQLDDCTAEALGGG